MSRYLLSKLYHGLFQDKALWGELIGSSSEKLVAARRKMLTHLVDRMAAEIEAGLVTTPDASILQLTSKIERVPVPDAYLRFDGLLARLGSDELRRYGLESV